MRFSRRIGISVAVSRVRPLLDASFLNFRRFVSFGEFVCHRRSKIRCNGNGIVSKNDRSDSVLEDIFVVGQCRPNFLSLGSVVAGSVITLFCNHALLSLGFSVVGLCEPDSCRGVLPPLKHTAASNPAVYQADTKCQRHVRSKKITVSPVKSRRSTYLQLNFSVLLYETVGI